MRRYGVVIKLLAAAAVALASAPAPELPLAFCEDIEVIDTKVLLDGRRDNVITRRAKTLAILKDFYGRANPDKVANARAIATEYEGFEEFLYDRLERQYKYVPGGPFKVWRTGPPFPAPEARDIIPPESPDL